MDIDEYLRQKRELEKEKELLEAKDRLRHEKEKLRRIKAEVPKSKVRVEENIDEEAEEKPVSRVKHEEREKEIREIREPFLKPWMIWDLIILIVIISLFSVFYFFPPGSFNKENSEIKTNGEVNNDQGLITGRAIKEPDTEEETKTEENIEEEPENETEKEEEKIIPGPDFTIYLKDAQYGMFNEQGRVSINDEFKVLTVLGASYYDGFFIVLENKERNVIKCFVDRMVKIDTDFDTEIDTEDADLDLHVVEIDGGSKEEISDVLPGEVKSGEYLGVGQVQVDYDVRCYYCIDVECEDWEERGESRSGAFAKVNIGTPTNSSA